MKHRIPLTAILLLLSFIFGCQNRNKELDFEPEPFDKFNDTLSNDYAKGFTIVRKRNSVEIIIKNPDNGEILEKYSISNTTGEEIDFPNPIQRVVAMSTTHLGVLKRLGLNNKLVGVNDYKYLCELINKDDVKEIGDISVTNPEMIMSTSPDIVFYSGFDLKNPILDKLKKVNVNTFLIYDWKENHPLGRAEWLKVFGILFQKEKEASIAYMQIKKDYLQIKDHLSKAKKRPSVFVGTYYNDIFNGPLGDSYMAQIISDANANYVYSDKSGTGSYSYGMEEVITKNKNTEFWLNAAATSLKELKEQSKKFKLLQSFQSNRVYTYFSNSNCYFENSDVIPDVILKDIGKIFHPELFEDTILTYYLRLR